jgi:hypothetical protein
MSLLVSHKICFSLSKKKTQSMSLYHTTSFSISLIIPSMHISSSTRLSLNLAAERAHSCLQRNFTNRSSESLFSGTIAHSLPSKAAFVLVVILCVRVQIPVRSISLDRLRCRKLEHRVFTKIVPGIKNQNLKIAHHELSQNILHTFLDVAKRSSSRNA